MLTSSNFSGLITPRFFKSFFPIPPTSALQVGDRAPSFTLPDIRNQTSFDLDKAVSAYQGKGDRKILLAFTRIFTEHQYCPLCYPHILALNNAYERLRDYGIDVVMITSTDQEQSSIVVRDLMLNMPLLSDSSCQTFQQYQVGQALGAPLPAQFLIDASGTIQFRHLFSFIEPNANVERLLTL
ncbi:MAG: peroxiredoxin family protein [Cyanobacteria bacterium P01_F01_bin.150]